MKTGRPKRPRRGRRRARRRGPRARGGGARRRAAPVMMRTTSHHLGSDAPRRRRLAAALTGVVASTSTHEAASTGMTAGPAVAGSVTPARARARLSSALAGGHGREAGLLAVRGDLVELRGAGELGGAGAGGARLLLGDRRPPRPPGPRRCHRSRRSGSRPRPRSGCRRRRRPWSRGGQPQPAGRTSAQVLGPRCDSALPNRQHRARNLHIRPVWVTNKKCFCLQSIRAVRSSRCAGSRATRTAAGPRPSSTRPRSRRTRSCRASSRS